MFLMFNNIWNERVFRTVLKLPLKPLLLFLFFFFLYAPGNVFDGLAFRMFSVLYQSSNQCYDKRSEKNKQKKTRKSKELKTSTILDLLFLSYLS